MMAPSDSVISLTVLLLTITQSVAKQPNIIFIMADDLGWDDLSIHGSDQIPTPNIDQLANDGILLNNYYVQPICTPSRAALMSGRYPIHTGMQHDVIHSSQRYGLGLNQTLLPGYLKQIGYKTHMVGKWHLGYFAKEYTPTYRGFDSHFGYYQGCEDYFDHTLQDGGQGAEFWGLDFWRDMEVDRTEFGQYSTEIFTTEAEKIISEHDTEKPLFLYLAHQAVHSGNPGNAEKLQAPWKYIQRFLHIEHEGRRKYAAMVSALDDSIGGLIHALNSKNLLQNTVIVFSADNGGPANGTDYNYACNWPLRGMKRTMWEGGLRANGFVWSPLLKQSSYVSNHMIHITDWLPTLLDVAGYDMSTLPRDLDGSSHWKSLSMNTKGSRNQILHNIDPIDGDGALRVDDWKVVFGGGYTKERDGWFQPPQLTSVNRRPPNQEPRNNQVTQIFAELGRDTSRKLDYRDVVVQCNKSVVVTCQPWVAPCLFNIAEDPCEYHNLAQKYPAVLKEMLDLVSAYNKTSAPLRNQPVDPAGLPGRLGGVWRPWVTLE